MVGHRGQARRRRAPDHERKRHHGRARPARGQEEGRLTGHSILLPKSRAPDLKSQKVCGVPKGEAPGIYRPHVFGTRHAAVPETEVHMEGKPICPPRKSNSRSTRVTECCAASTLSPTRYA